MKVKNGQQVLLAFAWMTGRELRMFEKFPEMLCADVTEKTNLEKRGLFIVTGQDGNGKGFICFHCFMPNSQMDSFQWIFSEAIPQLLGNKAEDILGRNEVVITDGELALFSPLQTETEDDESFWHGTRARRCTFHLFTQEWRNKIMNGSNTNKGKIALGVIHEWITSLVNHVQEIYQFRDSVKRLEKFMKVSKKDIGEIIFRKMMSIWQHMYVLRTKWAKCFRKSQNKFDIDHTTTSHTEAMNRSMKHGSQALASMNLDRSADKLVKHSNNALDRKER